MVTSHQVKNVNEEIEMILKSPNEKFWSCKMQWPK